MTEFKDRALKKSFLTRAVNKAKRQMNDGEVDNITVTLTDLTKLIGDYDLAHDAYVATLDNGADIASADNYYDEVCDKYNLVRKECTEYVNNPKGVKVEKNNDQPTMTSTLMEALNLPRIELFHFDGNPWHYTTFMTVFRESVESVTSDGQKRLNQLFHHTTGEARRTVEPCIALGGQAGYEQAMSRLKDRYGSPHVICEAVMSDLRGCSDANTPLELRHFADLLSGALIVLRQHGRYSDMDTQKFILTMCLKLQSSLRYKWPEIAADTLAKSGSYPLLDEFVSFVETRATVYNDPIYGGDALMDLAHTPSITPQKRTPSFAANTGYKPAQCVMCNGNHKLFMCGQFKDCSVLERVKYVTDNKLCSVCLSPNHVTDMCRVDYRCPILDCNARHSKYIHVDSSDASVSSSSNFAVNISRDDYVMLPILPVTINNTFHTYALLDTGSSNSFCSRRLIDRLNINGPVTTYELNTIGKTVYQRSEMVNFKMSTISISIDMNNIRVVNYIPTQSGACDLSEYSHLDGLRCPGNVTVTVDILIGQDYPYLLRPLEVRSGANSNPFAIRSALGWKISGPVISQPTCRRVISNSISTVTIEEKHERPCEADTFDGMPNLSPKDTRVIDQLTVTIPLKIVTLKSQYHGRTLMKFSLTLVASVKLP